MLRDLTRTMFFKAGFNVKAEQGQDALWKIVLDLRKWVLGKAKRSGFDFPSDSRTWTRVKHGTSIKSSDGSTSLTSCLHIDDGIFTWACVLIEDKGAPAGTSPREWVTEIGFKGTSQEEGRFSVVLSYEDRPGFIGKLQDDPDPSVPGIVAITITDKELFCSESGIKIGLDAMEITPEFAALSLIIDERRQLPVVLIAPTATGELPLNPESLAHALGPNALVLYTNNCDVISALNRDLERFELQCLNGSLRVYSPKPAVDQPGEFTRHRYIAANDLRSDPEDAVLMLRRALAQDVHFWTSLLRIVDVKRMNWASSNEKRFEAKKGELEDEVFEEMLKAEKKVNNVERKLNFALQERDELREENYQLKARCDSYEQAFKSPTIQSRDKRLYEFLSAMSGLPKKPDEVAKLAVAVFSFEIDFSERGWSSLVNCTTDSNILWAALKDISLILHPMFAHHKSIDIASEFSRQSKFSYARSEGKQTRKDPKLMAQREDTYNGRKIFIEKHISSSTGDPSSKNFLRLYFDYDTPSEKIVIGQCGGHMNNYTTKSLH